MMSHENPGRAIKPELKRRIEKQPLGTDSATGSQGGSGTQIERWVINSPDRVKIVACGGPGSDLVKGIFENYPEKLKGIEHQIFDKPTKPDFLELKLTPDYRNIRSASIKKELEATLLQYPNERETQDSETVTGPEESIKNKLSVNGDKRSAAQPESGKSIDHSGQSTAGQKPSIFNKFKSLLGSRQKIIDEGSEPKLKTAGNVTGSPDNGSGTASKNQEADVHSGESVDTRDEMETCSEEHENSKEDELGKIALETGQDIRDVKVQQARAELEKELMELFDGTDLLFIVTDLKSTYGLDNSLITAKLAKQRNIITVGLLFLPDKLDKLEEVEYGNRAMHSFRLKADIIVAVPYMENLLEGYLVVIINELLELITTSGLVNLDVADIKTVVGSGNVAMMGFGSGRSYDHNKIMEAINEALTSPLLKIDLNGVNRTLVNVTGDSSMTISEAQKAAKVILSKIQPDARLIWGAAVKPKLKGAIKVMIMAGISPKNILVNIYANS